MKEYHRAWYEAHKDEQRAKSKEYNQAHINENKIRCKEYYEAHKDEIKAYRRKWNLAHKEKKRAYNKTYRATHKEKRMAYNNVYSKQYTKTDINSSGVRKNSIRSNSNYYLFTILKHSKLKGYEIHHCFGYDDYKCFIYIPKELHLQIHQFLRDNGISADSNHFSQIVHLINGWNGYTYIKV